MKYFKNLILFFSLLLLCNCNFEENPIEDKKIEFIKNVKTVSFQDAKSHFDMKKSKKQLYHKTSKNNIIINPDWNTLMYNDVAYTNAKLTTAKTEINRKGNYSSELCFINVNNHLKNVIFTVWKDETDQNDNLINGRVFFNDLEGNFIDGYKIENGIFTKSYVIKKQIQKASLFSFLFFQSNDPEDSYWNLDVLDSFDGGVLDEVIITAPAASSGRENEDGNGNDGNSGGGYGAYVNGATSNNSMPFGGGGSLSSNQINSAAAAILMVSPVKPDKEGECPAGYVLNSTTNECESICKQEGRTYNTITEKCDCPMGQVEDASGKCVKKPCVGDPLAIVEIAPQLGASGMQGALHDTCARFDDDYTCRGVRGRRKHDGVDLKNPYGAPIFASYDGIAKEGTQRNIKTGKIKGAGHYVGVTSRVNGKKIRLVYFHLQKDRRTTGTIKAGDIIGYQGDSGNLKSAIEDKNTTSHVHVKAQENGKSAEPLDHFKTKINPKTGELINPCN
jgi:hypothetical protein